MTLNNTNKIMPESLFSPDNVCVCVCCVRQYLASVRQLSGYGEVVFSHCPCVVLSVLMCVLCPSVPGVGAAAVWLRGGGVPPLSLRLPEGRSRDRHGRLGELQPARLLRGRRLGGNVYPLNIRGNSHYLGGEWEGLRQCCCRAVQGS